MNTTITIVGNVTRDPQLRFTASGIATASFGVAVNRKLPPRIDGSLGEAVTFFNVVAWQSLAENTAESLHKGNRVVVTGRLEQRSWESVDGDRRTIYELVADEIGPSLRWVTASLTRVEKQLPNHPDDLPLREEDSQQPTDGAGYFGADIAEPESSAGRMPAFSGPSPDAPPRDAGEPF